MMSKLINTLFDRMDQWRHLPNYQLERRADIFFSLYLPEVLEAKLCFPVKSELAPEFPIHFGTSHRSYKIDYVAVSEKGDKAILVELKTDGRSRRSKQDDYLAEAQEVGIAGLLDGLLKIFRATSSKQKYFCLLEQLERMKLLSIPMGMREIMNRPFLKGITEASHQVKITTNVQESLIVYVQPNGDGSDIISFHEFSEVIRRHDDPVSQRFASSLHEWASVQAGEHRSNLPME